MSPNLSSPRHAVSVFTHGINFAVMMVDLLICRQPLYCAHITVPLAYSLTYLLFTLLYFAAGGVFHKDRHSPYIYDVLDWSDPGAAGSLSGLIVVLVIPILYMMLIGCYLLRTCPSRQAPAAIAPQAPSGTAADLSSVVA